MWIATPVRALASPLPPIVAMPSMKSVGVVGIGSGSQRSRFGDGSLSANGALRHRPLSMRRNGGMHRRGQDAVEPRAPVRVARRGERRAGKLLGVKPERRALRRVAALAAARPAPPRSHARCQSRRDRRAAFRSLAILRHAHRHSREAGIQANASIALGPRLAGRRAQSSRVALARMISAGAARDDPIARATTAPGSISAIALTSS